MVKPQFVVVIPASLANTSRVRPGVLRSEVLQVPSGVPAVAIRTNCQIILIRVLAA
jgi:hypothetical protein